MAYLPQGTIPSMPSFVLGMEAGLTLQANFPVLPCHLALEKRGGEKQAIFPSAAFGHITTSLITLLLASPE